MKAKIAYAITTVALVMGAFLVGKSTSIPGNYIPMGTAIPIEDIAEQYIGTDGCPMRGSCYRARAKPDKLQSWTNFEYFCNENSGFDEYIKWNGNEEVKR